MKALLLALSLIGSCALAGLDAHRDLVVADPKPASRVAAGRVRVTYLGTNGYLLEARGATLLVDPYFSRVGLGRVGFGLKMALVPERVDAVLAKLPRRIDAVLVTHAHFDHLLDAPEVARRTGARLLASETGVALAESVGLPADRCRAVKTGETLTVKSARIHVLRASHDHVFGVMPYPGVRSGAVARPRRATDWVCGEPLAFLIEMAGQRIYLDSGGTSAVLPSPLAKKVDLAIAGVALPDSRTRLPALLDRLRPRYFLPSHQDDFFRPLDRGFTFGTLTDFPHVRRLATKRQQRLILLDYFRPWTLR
jgi:L-ascorbate metabolism protein UlaG (beta-lactamase superfamily)